MDSAEKRTMVLQGNCSGGRRNFPDNLIAVQIALKPQNIVP